MYNVHKIMLDIDVFVFAVTVYTHKLNILFCYQIW